LANAEETADEERMTKSDAVRTGRKSAKRTPAGEGMIFNQKKSRADGAGARLANRRDKIRVPSVGGVTNCRNKKDASNRR
jgi:hypothetical protein